MRKLFFILSLALITSTFTIAQEANPEAQRRGWNVPRAERERNGFGRPEFRFKAKMRERQEVCECDCHKSKKNKRFKKHKRQ